MYLFNTFLQILKNCPVLDFGHFVLRNTQGIPWIFSNDKKLNQLRLRKQKK